MKIVSESEEKLLQNDLANYLLDYAAKNKIKHYIIPGEPRDISFSYKKIEQSLLILIGTALKKYHLLSVTKLVTLCCMMDQV